MKFQSLLQIFLRFFRFGCLAWGGPVAQIAMIKKELVEEEHWVTKDKFNRALAVYQVLPGPEAHELCVYFGMTARGRWGGFLAGIGFMLPGFVLMLLLIWFYISYGIQSPVAQIIFTGFQAAVVALIVAAVHRIGKHSLVNIPLFVIGAVSAFAYYCDVSFLIILPAAGFAYSLWMRGKNVFAIIIISLLMIFSFYNLSQETIHLQKSAATVVSHDAKSSLTRVFVTGLKGGLLTFGGAYTVIPFIQEDAVIKYGWMTNEQFLDGIALTGIIPTPLIMFSTFAGYFGGGWPGALIITLAIFLPAFSFTLIGHNYLEKVIENKALHNFLDGIAAGVIGLIFITALELLPAVVDGINTLIIFAAALVILYTIKSKYVVVFVIAGAGFFNYLFHQIN
jgi:chromate transporter